MIIQGCVILCWTVVFFQKSRNLSRSLLTNNNFYCDALQGTKLYIILWDLPLSHQHLWSLIVPRTSIPLRIFRVPKRRDSTWAIQRPPTIDWPLTETIGAQSRPYMRKRSVQFWEVWKTLKLTLRMWKLIPKLFPMILANWQRFRSQDWWKESGRISERKTRIYDDQCPAKLKYCN